MGKGGEILGKKKWKGGERYLSKRGGEEGQWQERKSE